MARSFTQGPDVSAAVCLAERLLAEAEACPALISRRASADMGPRPERSPALAVFSDPVPDVRPQLEHLASIAAASAQRPKALASLARRRSRNVRWQMFAAGSLGVMAVLIGAIGFVASREADTKLALLRALTKLRQLEIVELAAQNSNARAEQTKTTAGRPETPVVRLAAPASQAPRIRYSAQPSPDPRRSTSMLRRQVTRPRFLAGFERDIQAVLR
jgi:hypothetical protein